MLADAGAAGAIVPDLPAGGGGPVAEALRGADSRSFPWSRRRPRPSAGMTLTALARRASSCVVSDTRTTGERERLPAALGEPNGSAAPNRLYRLQVGFGIGTLSWQAAVGRIADGVIIGSRLVRAVSRRVTRTRAAAAVAEFIRDARTAMSR